MICPDPACTGWHSSRVPTAKRCPAFAEQHRQRMRAYRRVHPETYWGTVKWRVLRAQRGAVVQRLESLKRQEAECRMKLESLILKK